MEEKEQKEKEGFETNTENYEDPDFILNQYIKENEKTDLEGENKNEV
jgi:hypothetical protein